MPDLTIEIFAVCESIAGIRKTNIGGYVQEIGHGQTYQDHCTCKAFQFSKGPNKTCKHLKQAYEEECGWHGAYDEPQIEEGKCPRCGGPVEYVRVAV